MGMKSISVMDRWYKRIRDNYGISREKLEKWRKQRKEKFERGEQALNRYLEEGADRRSVQGFFQTCINEKSFGRNFSREEVIKLGKAIFMDEVFLTKANLKFVMTGYTEKCDYQMCKEYFGKLLRFYKDTIYGKAIEEFIQEYNRKIREIKRNEMEKIPVIPTGNGDGNGGQNVH